MIPSWMQWQDMQIQSTFQPNQVQVSVSYIPLEIIKDSNGNLIIVSCSPPVSAKVVE